LYTDSDTVNVYRPTFLGPTKSTRRKWSDGYMLTQSEMATLMATEPFSDWWRSVSFSPFCRSVEISPICVVVVEVAGTGGEGVAV